MARTVKRATAIKEGSKPTRTTRRNIIKMVNSTSLKHSSTTRTTRNSRRASAALATTSSDSLSRQPSNRSNRASQSVPLSVHTSSLLTSQEAPLDPSQNSLQLSSQHSQASSLQPSQELARELALDHLELQSQLAPNSSMLSSSTSKPVMPNNTSILKAMTDNFLQILLSTDNRHRQISKRRGSLSIAETFAWTPLSMFKISKWPNESFLISRPDDDDNTALTFEKYNLAYFFAETIQNPQHICNQSVSWFVRSMLVDRHTNKLKTLDQTTLNFIIQLEVQKLGFDLLKKKKSQANRLFDRKGKPRMSFVDYLAMLGGEWPNGSNSSVAYVPDAISENMFSERCDAVSKDIATVNTNGKNYGLEFPLENLINSCLDLIKRYPPSISTTSNGNRAQVSSSDIEDSPPDIDGDLNSTIDKSPDCSTDEEQDTPSFKVESLLHRPASPARSNSNNSHLQSPTLGRRSLFEDLAKRYHATAAGHQGHICKQLLNSLDSNPTLFERTRDTSAPLQSSSITTPMKLVEHQPHVSKSAAHLARPNKAHHTTLSSAVKTLSQSILKVSAGSNTTAGPLRPAFQWNQTQSDASQIEFETPPSPEDEPAVDSLARDTEQTNAQLDGAPDSLSNDLRTTAAKDGEEAAVEPARTQGAASKSPGSPTAELLPPSSSPAQSPVPQRKSRQTFPAAEDIDRTGDRPAITGIELFDELDISPGLSSDRTTRPPEKTVLATPLQIHSPEPSSTPVRNSQYREKSLAPQGMLNKSSPSVFTQGKSANPGENEDVAEMSLRVPEEGGAGRADLHVTETPAQDNAAPGQENVTLAQEDATLSLENAPPALKNAALSQQNVSPARDNAGPALDNAAESPSHDAQGNSFNSERRSVTTAKHGFLPLSSSDSEPEPNSTSRPARSPPLRGSGRVQGRSHPVMEEEKHQGDEDQDPKKRPRQEGESDASMARISMSQQGQKERPRGEKGQSASKEARRRKAAGLKGPRSDVDEPNVPHAAWRTKPVTPQKQADDSSDLMNITSDPSTSDSENESPARTRIKRRTPRAGSRRFWTPEEEKLLIREVEKNYRHPNCMAEILQRHGPNGYKSQTFANRTGVMLKDKAVNLSTKWMREGIELSAKRKKAFARFPLKSRFLDNYIKQSSGRETRGERQDRASRSLLRTNSKRQESSSESEAEPKRSKQKTMPNLQPKAPPKRRIESPENISEDNESDQAPWEMADSKRRKKTAETQGGNKHKGKTSRDDRLAAPSKRRIESSPATSEDDFGHKHRVKVIVRR